MSIKVIVLLSGGVDSAACLCYQRKRGSDVSCLFVDYGQSASLYEAQAAEAISKYYDTGLRTVRLSGGPPFGEGIIPGRNALLLNIALMAFEFSAGVVSIGIHSDTDYADCTAGFVSGFQAIFDLYRDGSVQINAPFLSWTKSEVWSYCVEQEVPLSLTYSCELGRVPPCGRCRSCLDIRRLNEEN